MLTLENSTDSSTDEDSEETVGISGVDCTIGLVLFIFSLFIIAGWYCSDFGHCHSMVLK